MDSITVPGIGVGIAVSVVAGLILRYLIQPQLDSVLAKRSATSRAKTRVKLEAEIALIDQLHKNTAYLMQYMFFHLYSDSVLFAAGTVYSILSAYLLIITTEARSQSAVVLIVTGSMILFAMFFIRVVDHAFILGHVYLYDKWSHWAQTELAKFN